MIHKLRGQRRIRTPLRFEFPFRDLGPLFRGTMALSTWISEVTNSTLNMTLSTFSFQDALNPSVGGYSNPPYLFHNACLQDNGTQDCTASCQDLSQIFGSLDTLHNCMVYPTVADLAARNNLSNASLAEYYNIQKSKVGTGLSKNITTTIQTCLVDYCTTTLSGSGCQEYLYGVENTSSPLNVSSAFYIYNTDYENSYNEDDGGSRFDLCMFIPNSLNPDIGGIGVGSFSMGLRGICLLRSG